MTICIHEGFPSPTPVNVDPSVGLHHEIARPDSNLAKPPFLQRLVRCKMAQLPH